MKTLIPFLVLALSMPAFAQDPPADAPLLYEADGTTLAKGRTAKLATGQPAPFPGYIHDNQEDTRTGKIHAREHGENLDLKKSNVILPTAVFWGGLTGAVVLAVAGGIAIGVAASKSKP